MTMHTMNRIDRMFSGGGGEILSVYMTAGYPELDDTVKIIRALQENGADMVEIGIPFSDPLADGPVIQHSSQVALGNGMSVKRLFRQLEGIRDNIDIPLVLMGYLNPILRFGVEGFLQNCRDTGIDGVIIPDLPPEVYAADYRKLFRSHGIHHPLLVTLHTGKERVVKIAGLSGGFLYLVADASTTGEKSSVKAHQIDYFRRIGEMGLGIPALVGFGISSHETFRAACRFARGAIIGSAFIRMLGEEGAGTESVGRFVRRIRTGSRD